MGRWAYLDSDEERLPEGMRRIGYDADTQTYTYEDSRGVRWEGAPGARYGRLHRVNTEPRRATLPSFEADEYIDGDEPAYVLHDADHDPDSEEDGKDEKSSKDEKLSRRKSIKTTFGSILGDKQRASEPKTTPANIRRWSSLSQAASKLMPKLPPLPGDLRAAGQTGEKLGEKHEEEKHKGGERKEDEQEGEKPLPPLPRRRATTITSISNNLGGVAQGVAQGVKQMFSEKSEFRGHRT